MRSFSAPSWLTEKMEESIIDHISAKPSEPTEKQDEMYELYDVFGILAIIFIYLGFVYTPFIMIQKDAAEFMSTFILSFAITFTSGLIVTAIVLRKEIIDIISYLKNDYSSNKKND